MTHAVVALALPGVVAFDLSTAAQVFGHPEEDEYSFEVVTSDGRQVPSSTGFQIAGVGDPSSLRRADTIVIPGYSPHITPSDDVLEALRSAHSHGTRVVSICTGAFALAPTGLLDGLSATTHWQDAQELRTAYPAVNVTPDVLYIDHGHVASSAGVAAGIDLCLHLVRRDHGAATANRIARRMVVPPPPRRRPGPVRRTGSPPPSSGEQAGGADHLGRGAPRSPTGRRGSCSPCAPV